MAKKDDSNLSEEDKAEIQKYLDEKWTGQKACPACNSNNWIIGDEFVTPIILGKGGGFTLGGTAFPQFMLICSACGYTHYFNAMVSGIWQRFKQKKKEPASKEKSDDGERSDG